MQISVIKNDDPQAEKRVPLVPESVARLIHKGMKVVIEQGLGEQAGIPDDRYVDAGASVHTERRNLLSIADMVIRIHRPPLHEIRFMKKNAVHVSFLDPFNDREHLNEFVENEVKALSLQMIPRVTRAQKMDVLSSQANLAGYVAVILAAERLNKAFPMMITPAGTITPARVFVIGAGVAGLQAIATAKRLGARVEAFDTRPEVEEQVHSLGARFVKADLGETGQTEQGYARALTAEQVERQQAAMEEVIARSDVVITTALSAGRKAPLIVTREALAKMRNGSVAVDLAVEAGGNIQDVRPDEEIRVGGVLLLGFLNLPGRVAEDASKMLSGNLVHLVEEFWDDHENTFRMDPADEILDHCLVTTGSKINPRYQEVEYSIRELGEREERS